MAEDIYKTVFVDPITKAHLKPDALQLINKLYCKRILDITDQVDELTEGNIMMTMLQKVLFCYYHRNRYYMELDSLEDFGEIIDHYYDQTNGHSEIMNFGK